MSWITNAVLNSGKYKDQEGSAFFITHSFVYEKTRRSSDSTITRYYKCSKCSVFICIHKNFDCPPIELYMYSSFLKWYDKTCDEMVMQKVLG